MTSRLEWQHLKIHRMALVVKERDALKAEVLAIHRENTEVLTKETEDELERINKCIAECNADFDRILQETYEQFRQEQISHQQDEKRKER